MEPDRFEAIARDEQRAVIAANEQYRQLQDHVPRVVGEGEHRHWIRLAIVVIIVLLAVAALAGWLLR